MKRFTFLIITAASCIFFSLLPSTGMAAYIEPVLADYTSYPLFLTDTVAPNIMIILDNSLSMNQNAYGPSTRNGQLVGDSYNGIPYGTIIKPIAISSDDAEQLVSNGNSYFNQEDLDIGRDLNGGDYSDMMIGLRFQNLPIPQGAIIGEAYIEFTNKQDYSTAPEADITISIYGENTDDSFTFTTSASNISSRPKTSSQVSWTIPEWAVTDEIKRTPDITSVVQEIINRPGWADGNALSIIFKNPSGEPASGRTAYSYDGNPSKAPRLYIRLAQPGYNGYYGYFNPDFFYTYGSKFEHKYKKVSYNYVNKTWTVISDLATINSPNPTTKTLTDALIVSEGLWDGNWMNWMTMRKIDVLRKVIMGGHADSRTGGGVQVNNGEAPAGGNLRDYARRFNTTSTQAVTPYDSDKYYIMNGGYVYVHTNTNPNDGSPPKYTIKVQKDIAYEPEDFVNYDSGDNLGGVFQKYGDKARWGNMWFYYGTGSNQSGGEVKNVIGTNFTNMITNLQNTPCDTYTPLAETLYVANQYFKQEDVDTSLDFFALAAPNNTDGQDPYWNGTEYVTCAKSFVILLTDGASTMDSKLPASLKNFDGDSNDNTLCNEASLDNTNCDYPSRGTDYLDDVALYGRTTDLRSDLEGDQNVILYTVYAMGDDNNARRLLMDAARNGGFEDRNGNNRPDGDYTDPPEDRLEWDKNEDGLPDNYFEAKDGYELEKALGKAITDILRRAASGTAVSIISSATQGEGNIIQAYFRPAVPSATDNSDIVWTGSLQSLWIDPYGNMREDTPEAGLKVGDHKLDVAHDKIIAFTDVNGETKVNKYNVSSTTPYPDISSMAANETVSLSDMYAFFPVWEAGSKLGVKSADDRKIFTYLDRTQSNPTTPVTYTDDPFDDAGEVIEFSTANTDIKPYLGVQSDTAWDYLGLTHDDRFNNIINFIRGQNSGFTGNALIRDRSVPLNPADAENTLVDWKLGDIVNSTPMIVAQPFENYDLLYSDESYYEYYLNVKDREAVVYAGANDGMIHAFTSWKYDSSSMTYIQPSGTTEDIGDELWAYIPRALLPHLKWLPGDGATGEAYTHVYYCDMRMKIFEAKILPDNTHYTDDDSDPNWGTFLLAGLNYGGKHIWAQGDFSGSNPAEVRHFYPSYVCIDITDPRNPRLMWERTYSKPAAPAQTAANDTDLGLATSYPSIVKVNNNWFGIIGSGPHNFEGTSNKEGHVFIVDLATGAPFKNTSNSPVTDWLFKTGEDDAFMGNPVSLDKNMNYNVDAIYIPATYNAGNATNPNWDGAIYKIRVPFTYTSPAPVDCQGSVVYDYGESPCGTYISTPNDASSPWVMRKIFDGNEPITAAPVLSIDGFDNAWIFFGTGRYLSDADETDTSTQYIYGIKDPFFNAKYISSPAYDPSKDFYHNTALNKLLTSTDASEIFNTDDIIVTLTGELSENAGASFSTKTFNEMLEFMRTKDGWQRTLEVSGERVITKPGIIGGTLLVSSFKPNQDICSYGGFSYLYALYYESGTAYRRPAFLGTYATENTTIGGTPKQKINDVISLGEGMASSVGVHVGRQENNTATGFIQTSKGFIKSLGIDPALGIRSNLENWQEVSP